MAAKRVLIVEDHQDTLECAQAMLEFEFEVVAAGGGEAALRSLASEHFDAMMLDLTMPEVDGYAVMAVVRERFPELPVLVTSALPEVQQIAENLGAQDWVSKPYRLELLPQRLRRLMAGSGDAGGAPVG